MKDEAASILIEALGDTALRVCRTKVYDHIAMLELLDKRYASNRAASRISLLTSLFPKRYTQGQDMGKYVDEFEVLFAQLEKMGNSTTLPEKFKAP